MIDSAPAASLGENARAIAPPWPRAPLLLCASSSRTGPVEGLIALGSFLRARGIDARFAGDRVREGEDLPGHLERAGLPWAPGLRLSRKVRAVDLLRDAATLTDWVREGAPDVLQATFSHDYLLALWATRRAGPARAQLRLVREAHRRVDLEPGRFGLRARLLKKADGVIVRAQSYRRALLSQGFAPERVAAIPGGVDASLFTPGRTGAAWALRRAWGVPDGAPLAGIVARMKPERLHEKLLRAFAASSGRAPHAHLVLIGRGEEEPALRALAQALDPRRIHFGGYQRGPALVEAYRALDVAVWLREGNDGACRGVLEAMACGLPLLVGDEGAPPELIGSAGDEDGPACGRVADPLDAASLSNALAGLLADESLRAALGAAARARAERFTLERSAAATLDFWRRLRALPPVEQRQSTL